MKSRTLLACAVTLAAAGSLAACSGDDGPDPADAAGRLAAALTRGKLGPVTFAEDSPISEPPQKWWEQTTEDLGGATVKVRVADVTEAEDGQSATARLGYAWTLPDVEREWSYDATARLVRAEDDTWRVRLEPALLGLRKGEVFDMSTQLPDRAPVLGAGGEEIVRDRPVLRFGVDKAQAKPAQQVRAARRLAAVVDVDADALVDRVQAAGEKAFVEAIVLREADAAGALRKVDGVDGVGVLSDTLPLAPTREFARPILGTVGPVTAEIVKESDGAYEAGDEAGLSGLQQRYDERLRGDPGLVVRAVAGERSRKLFAVQPEPGKPLRTTLDLPLQQLAEEILADVGPASALVAIRPSDGDILAAASGPGSDGLNTATYGQYAPGSTFKVVSSLALLRAGLRPDSPVECPSTTVVDGKTFKNYDDYPAGGTGRITLRQAVANSCNTAFIEQRDRVEDLAGAAAALGLGVDHDLGFPAYFGAVPDAETETGAAAALIGQGKVLASPMVMATVAASVQQGETVVPRLLRGHETDAAEVEKPLTGAEARTLRGLMRAVVTGGSGSALSDVPGPPIIAKTGTAEFGDKEPLRTHAWMIAAQGDLAVAAFVEVGDSGSGTAGPLLEEFLRRR